MCRYHVDKKSKSFDIYNYWVKIVQTPYCTVLFRAVEVMVDRPNSGHSNEAQASTISVDKKHKQILARIRGEFRSARKASEKRIKKNNATTLNKTFRTHRPTYWIKLNGFAAKITNVDIDEPDLLSHYKNLFSPAQATNQLAKEKNNKMDLSVANEIMRIKSSQSRHYVDPYRIAIVMKNLRNNKSPGIKRIKNEYFKYGHNTDLPIILAKYLQLIIKSKAVPTNFNIGKIVPIIKDARGDVSE
jgi:hypothetical protein